MFFCDGSKDKVGAGAGIVYIRGSPDHSRPEDYSPSQFQFSLGCGKKTTSYDAEMLALAAAALHAYEVALAYTTNDLPFTDLFFFSDSTSALTNITDPGPHPGQIFSISFI
jgi:ribonuclease HI